MESNGLDEGFKGMLGLREISAPETFIEQDSAPCLHTIRPSELVSRVSVKCISAFFGREAQKLYSSAIVS